MQIFTAYKPECPTAIPHFRHSSAKPLTTYNDCTMGTKCWRCIFKKQSFRRSYA